MNIKSILKGLPGLVNLYHLFFKSFNTPDYSKLRSLSNDELLSLMRHESHRIEKAVYNNILEAKQSVYREKWERLSVIHQILKDRGYPANEPTIAWSKQIYDAFEVLETDFIQQNSKLAPQFNPNAAKQFVEFLRERRSVRVWAEEQSTQCILEAIAYSMIDAARWAPTSGNRQPWRFVILSNLEDKELLKKVKKNHCTSAPLLIFIGMDTRLYGAFGKSERSIYIDAGAAIMQTILLAHKCGLGVCWNHFADDLINSRNINKTIYSQFTKKLNIPEYIAPIAIVAIGYPSFIPPEPARMEIESLIIDSGKHKTLVFEKAIQTENFTVFQKTMATLVKAYNALY